MALIHIAKRANHGDRIIVTYDSTRSSDLQTRSGDITTVATEPETTIRFERYDGQSMKIDPDGLYSIGSTHPYTGAIVDIKLEEG